MRWLLLALALVALGGAVALGSAPGETAPVPRVAYKVRVLANGLKVVSVVDRSEANVAVQVWYGVGGRDDPQGRSGFAHLIEHLMFRGAKGMPPDYISRLTEDAGGDDNASTDSDFTEYDDLAPAERLPQLLWAEARRMSSLVVDDAGFRAERAVVEQELQQEVLSDPYGPLFEFAIPQAGFPVRAYSHSPIGSVADLEAATLQEAQAFHARYYRPDNATLVVVGDFDQARLNAWIDRYFGALARPPEPLPHPPRPQTGPVAARVVDTAGDNAPGPAVVLCYAAPRAGGRDSEAVKVLDALLSKGSSARLYASLIRDRRLASDVFSDVDLRQRAGMLDIGAMLAPGRGLKDGEAALAAVVSDLRLRPATDRELEGAKNQLTAQVLQDRETIEGLANQLGYAAVVEGDPAHVNTDLKALRAVTVADVRRVAGVYLADRRRVTLRYHPTKDHDPSEAGDQAGGGAARPQSISEHVEGQAASTAEPVGLPRLATAPTARPRPAPVEKILSNGLRVVVARGGRLPLATVLLRFRGGSGLDPAGKAGLTAEIASLGAQGAGRRSAAAISEAIAGIGESYSAEVDEETTTFRLTGLANLERSLPILADIVRRPRFGPAAFQRTRSRAEDKVEQSQEDLDSLTDLAVARLVYGKGPYGHAPDGGRETLSRITARDVIRQHALIYRPDNAVLVVAGDVDAREVFDQVERTFGDWAKPAGPPPEPAARTPPPGPGHVVLVDAPGETEATVVVAGRSVRRQEGSYYAVLVANSVLGGGFSSRLNQEIRVRRGLSYDVSSDVEPREGGGLFSATADTDAAAAPQVARLMVDQLKALAFTPPGRQELAARKAALIGDARSSERTSADLADSLAGAVLLGRGLADSSEYVRGVSAVTSSDVSAAASRLCDPNTVNILVVGDKKRASREMRRLFGRFENISVGQLSSGRFQLH